MFIYTFRSSLFQGMDQKRVIVSSFPLNMDKLHELVNMDNKYPLEGQWSLVESRE